MFMFHSPIPPRLITYLRFKTRTWASRAQKQMRKPRSKHYKALPFLAELKQLRDPDQVLSLFGHYSQMGFKHDYPSYSSLLYKLARLQNFQQIDPILHFIKDRNIRCRESLFIALMQHYGKSQLVDKAIELFYQMPNFNCERTLQSFNTLLNVLVANGRFCDASDLFVSSNELGFRPNSVSFNIMMKGMLARGELESALQVFDEMLLKEVQPTIVTYNSLIGFLCKQGEVEKAMKLFDDLIRKGDHPNAVTYALLMEGLCFMGKYSEAKKMMFDMEYRGCRPCVVNFGVLMTDLAQRGKLDEAKSLLLEMKKKKLKPDVVAYNILINFLCKEGRVEEGYKVLVEMQIKGCEPNAATYRMFVDAFCQVGEYEQGLNMLHAMLISQHCPRLESFYCLFMGLVKCGKMDDAGFILEEMSKRNMRFQFVMWDSLVRDVCDTGGATDKLVNDLIYAHCSA